MDLFGGAKILLINLVTIDDLRSASKFLLV